MPTPTDLHAALQALTPLRDRRPETTPEQAAGSYAHLGEVGQASAYVSSFSGLSEWERHPMGDELVQVLEGETQLTLLGETAQTLSLTAGSFVVVPKGVWHQFHAPDGVGLFTLTPQPTEHHRGEAPPRQSAHLGA